uniref:Nucleoside diphosphate-linked moiety X motif 19-like isoform X1 n=2 Tax=Dermatophagoides pteronyssinus TaxID=6956 RepID=A0A6P6XTH2_DERPT|nr:nucleoside diphosphate-linked moiety X motif 19-like isoform X1 [Dermatophagoides pteronyssinus]
MIIQHQQQRLSTISQSLSFALILRKKILKNISETGYSLRTISDQQKFQPMAPYPKALEQQPNDMSKLPKKQSWKEASSLIILAPDNQSKINLTDDQNLPIKFDYNTLMVKRSVTSSFFASAYVFPGGQVELSDFEYKWYDLFEKYGINLNDLDRISMDIVGPRPPMITDPITLKGQSTNMKIINMDIGLRITAIRETFEEAGILLLVDPKNHNDNDYCKVLTSKSLNTDLNEWRQKIRSDSGQFIQLCDQLKMVPNVWSLYEWSNWLTPISVGHRRFDTMFYVCCFEQKPPVFVDNAEVTTPIWCNPIEILETHRLDQAFLAPPQVYELSRFLRFPKMDRLYRFMRSRQTLGCQRWLPVFLTYDDGALSLVPGDEQYPTEPLLVSDGKQIPEFNGSVHDANRNAKSKNRMELMGIKCRAICTIEPGCGHIPPITYPFNDDSDGDEQSKPIAKL